MWRRRVQSKDIPIRRKDRACCSMLAYVHSFGGIPRRIAAFSAGRPNASQPIGCRTLYPRIAAYRATTSPPLKASACPMWRSPEG
ncbi:MAG: hypothetical protein KatS3mg014_2248 [Actinomycetota bacterium]|nr:MAG: hypothetical protein KatS3mg014_2248 [Actinomycetota bacterium]